MKTRKIIFKVIGAFSFLFMLSFISCEKQECAICTNSQGEELEACTAAGELAAYAMGYYCY
jgi:hypothetical protein